MFKRYKKQLTIEYVMVDAMSVYNKIFMLFVDLKITFLQLHFVSNTVCTLPKISKNVFPIHTARVIGIVNRFSRAVVGVMARMSKTISLKQTEGLLHISP